MDIHKVYGFFMNRFRPKRVVSFRARFPMIDAGITVLDVGGTLDWWMMVAPSAIRLTIVNLDSRHREEVEKQGYRFVEADGRNLPFADNEFDLVFANSVIEHVGSIEDQERFASELLRCGRNIYVQTPNKWFPVEPHLITVFLHWFPISIQRRCIRWFSIWGLVTKPSQERIDAFLKSTRLLSKSEISRLFPGCLLVEERCLGLAKSFVVLPG